MSGTAPALKQGYPHMAVRVLPRSLAQSTDRSPSLPVLVLGVVLVPSALDLLNVVQPGSGVLQTTALILATGVAAILLCMMWLRFPRTNWVAAASLAALVGFALRLAGADLAPLLSLLAILALGLGGGYASTLDG
jgi:hypothetical protein